MDGQRGGAGVPQGDPRTMEGGTGLVPVPIGKSGTTPDVRKNPGWLRRVFLGEPGARHPSVFLKRLARAFDSRTTGFYGPSYEIGSALDSGFQGIATYKDPRTFEELKRIGTTPAARYSEAQARKESVAEYVRRWLSGDPSLGQVAPNFTNVWNRWMQSDELAGAHRVQRDALENARAEIDVYQGLTPRERFELECQWRSRSLSMRTADAVQRVRDEGVVTVLGPMARTWGPEVLGCLTCLLLLYAALSYQRNEPHLFMVDGPSGEPVTVECYLNEWATGVDIYIRTSDGLLEPVEYHYFDSPGEVEAAEALAEFDADALREDLGLPPRAPHPLRDAAIAACEHLAPPPLSPEAIERMKGWLE